MELMEERHKIYTSKMLKTINFPKVENVMILVYFHKPTILNNSNKRTFLMHLNTHKS